MPVASPCSSASRTTPSSPFILDSGTIPVGRASHGVLVITPRRPMVIGTDRLERLAGSDSVNEVERGLVDEAAQRSATAVILRAANDRGERLWNFDEGLSETELIEAGPIMCRALLPLHRRLAAIGVLTMVHTEWTPRDCYTMRVGAQRLLRERSQADDPLSGLDVWMLSEMLTYVARPAAEVTRASLPFRLLTADRDLSRLRALVAAVPSELLA